MPGVILASIVNKYNFIVSRANPGLECTFYPKQLTSGDRDLEYLALHLKSDTTTEGMTRVQNFPSRSLLGASF